MHEAIKQSRSQIIVDEGGAEGFAIAGGELFAGPGEVLAQAGVLLLQGHVRDGAGVSIDAEGDAGAIELIDAVFGVGGSGAGLHVAAGTDFEMNAALSEMADKSGIFDAADAVANAGGLEELERFPNAVGAARFACMRGAMQAVFDGVAVSGDVRGDWEACFVAGDIEGCDAGASRTDGRGARSAGSVRCGSGARCRE